MRIKGVLCACQAGSFAALASVCGKMAASSESASSLAEYGAHGIEQILGIPRKEMVSGLSVCVRSVSIAGIFLCNAAMWVLFTKSMHLCSSTLEATAFNTAANFIFTAVFGCLIFGDRVGFQWCCGSLLMVIGLVVLHTGSQQDTVKASDTNLPHGKEGCVGHEGAKENEKVKVS